MRWSTILTVFLVIWSLVVFVVLPIGIRTHREVGDDIISGQEQGAPANFRPKRVAIYTTALSVLFMALFYLNVEHHWVTSQSFAWLFPKPSFSSTAH